MKTLMLITSLLFVAGIQAEFQEKTPLYAVNPTVFILMRDEGIPGDWSKIINAALPEEERSKYLDRIKYWENIIIVDEGEFWAVSFHLRGNRMLSSKEGARGLHEWEGSPEDGDGKVVYLEKTTLGVCSIPDKGIQRALGAYYPFYGERVPIDLGKILDEFESPKNDIEDQQSRHE